MRARRSFCPRLAALLMTGTLAVGGCRTARDPGSWQEGASEPQGIGANELYARRFAGVRLYQFPDGILVIVRTGMTSFSAGRAPLYLVDGVPVAANRQGRLEGINVNDIDKIQVLKNIEDTAFYGARGANGVVLITTRRR